MKYAIQKNIEQLVGAIYKLEMKKIDAEFIGLLDNIESYVELHPDENWNGVLLHIQESYVKKDYVELADALLYELKPRLVGE